MRVVIADDSVLLREAIQVDRGEIARDLEEELVSIDVDLLVHGLDSRARLKIHSTPSRRTYICAPCGGIKQLIRLARAQLEALERKLTSAETRRYLQG